MDIIYIFIYDCGQFCLCLYSNKKASKQTAIIYCDLISRQLHKRILFCDTGLFSNSNISQCQGSSLVNQHEDNFMAQMCVWEITKNTDLFI